MSKIRVLHAIPNLAKAGAERMAVEICYGLSKRDDFEVLLVSFSPFNAFQKYTCHFQYKVCDSYVKLSILGKTEIKLDSFIKIVNEFKPDIIHSHLFRADLYTREILFPNIKYFSHQHGVDTVFCKPKFKNFFKKANLVKLYERNRILLKYKQCDNTFIAVSKYIEQFLRKNIPNKLQKIIMLYNAINTADFIVANKHDIRFSNNSRDKLNIVSVGTLIPRKNQKLQIEIIQELKKRGINVELNILGEGAEKQKLMEYTRLLGLDKEIRFLGNVDNVAEYFSNSDIMLHTSIDESFGLVLVEAMAAGLPCVALDGMGNREVISNGEEGYIIDKQDVYQFADKIQYIISDDNIWRSFSNKAASKAQQYDINNYIDDLSDIYKKSLVKGL